MSNARHLHVLRVVRANLTAQIAAMPPEETPERVLNHLGDAHHSISEAMSVLASLELALEPASIPAAVEDVTPNLERLKRALGIEERKA